MVKSTRVLTGFTQFLDKVGAVGFIAGSDNVLDSELSGGVTLPQFRNLGTLRMMHIDDELDRLCRVEDHAGMFGALHLQTLEMIEGFGHPVKVGVKQKTDIACSEVSS